jgi:hypothetical protein
MHRILLASRRQQCSLVHQVAQVGAGEPRGGPRELSQVDVRSQRHIARVDLEDRLPAVPVRQVHHHPAVEPAWAQERLVEHVGLVGRSEDDDSFTA